MRMTLSQEELDSRTLRSDTLETAVEQVRVNGYILFEKVIGDEVIREIHDKFIELFTEYIKIKGYNSGTNRAQMHLPFTEPFIGEEIIANSFAIPVIEALLGKDCRCIYAASDTPMPGSDYQNVHADANSLFSNSTVTMPAYNLVVNIPLVDTTELNGPLEVWPGGTHFNPDHTLYNPLFGKTNPYLDSGRAAKGMLSEKITMPAGSIVIRDIRMWHRGTPNRSNTARPNIALVYSNWWYGSDNKLHIPQASYDQLSERAKQLFRYERMFESVKMPWDY